MALKKYNKRQNYSYTEGMYPTIEMLNKIPDRVSTVLIDPKYQQSEGGNIIRTLCKKHGIRLDTSTKAIERIASKGNIPVIGVFDKFHKPIVTAQNHVLLDNPSDMGNVGTIIRTMLGFGIDNLALIRPGVDILHPKVVRASMGSLFDIKFEYFSNFEEYSERFTENTKYPFLLEGKRYLSETKFQEPFTLIFGNEGEGLSKKYNSLENTVKIDQKRDIDSLNLSIAAGIALYEATKGINSQN